MNHCRWPVVSMTVTPLALAPDLRRRRRRAAHRRSRSSMRCTYSRAAALDRAPVRPADEIEQPVVHEEAHERDQRIGAHLLRRRRPDRRAHRQQMILDEGSGVAVAVEIFAERQPLALGACASACGASA